MLVGKGPSGSDWFNILSYQTLHIHFCCLIMAPEEITAYFKRFREIHLICMFGFLFFDRHIRNDGSAEIMKYGASPDFLCDIFVFSGVKLFKTQRIFEVSERIFLVPPQVIQILKIFKIELLLRKVCHDILKRIGSDLKSDDTQGNVIFRMVVIQVVHGDSLADIAILICSLGAAAFCF